MVTEGCTATPTTTAITRTTTPTYATVTNYFWDYPQNPMPLWEMNLIASSIESAQSAQFANGWPTATSTITTSSTSTSSATDSDPTSTSTKITTTHTPTAVKGVPTSISTEPGNWCFVRASSDQSLGPAGYGSYGGVGSGYNGLTQFVIVHDVAGKNLYGQQISEGPFAGHNVSFSSSEWNNNGPGDFTI